MEWLLHVPGGDQVGTRLGANLVGPSVRRSRPFGGPQGVAFGSRVALRATRTTGPMDSSLQNGSYPTPIRRLDYHLALDAYVSGA